MERVRNGSERAAGRRKKQRAAFFWKVLAVSKISPITFCCKASDVSVIHGVFFFKGLSLSLFSHLFASGQRVFFFD